MNSELQAIKEAWEQRPAAGEASSGPDGVARSERDNKVVTLADKYVADHPEEFDGFKERSLESIVEALELCRLAGMEDDEWRLQVWIFHRFEFQNIGGPAQAQVRFQSEDK